MAWDRDTVRTIIFEAHTPAGKAFDVGLIIAITASVVAASIPKSIYWAVITMTTVGYGDLVPLTALGQGLAAVIMILGYGIIAIPTGIVTLEMSEAHRRAANTRVCPRCSVEGHMREATYCWRCGAHMYESGAAAPDRDAGADETAAGRTGAEGAMPP